MLTVHNLKKSFNHKILFENVTFSLNPAQRVGLIGANGCGKTTLLRILTGEEQADRGQISRVASLRIGYLPQGFEPDPQTTLGQLIGKVIGQAEALENELVRVAMALASHPLEGALEAQYDDLVQRLQNADLNQASKILANVGLADLDPGMPVRFLSGGQKTRLSLALVLLGDPQLLLLDEPTNHLDIQMLEWLESWLNASPCSALIVSHDRTFLDHTVTRILDMQPRLVDGEMKTIIREYPGNYSAYLAQYQAEIEKQWTEYKDQQLAVRHMRQDINRVKAQAAYTERQASSIRIGGPDMKLKGFKSYQQGIAKKVARKAKAREKKLDRYLESDERVEKPRQPRPIKLEFSQPTHQSRLAMRLEQLDVGYQQKKPLLQNLMLDLRAGQRVALSGPNGCGKTTLLRTIAGELPPLAGEVRFGASTRLGYLSQDQSRLDSAATPVKLIESFFSSETEARTFLAYFLFTGDEPLKPMSILSFGQRARLMLALLVAQGCNCLLMDEPVNHLDIPSRAQFEQALAHFDGAVLAVVHDRYFIQQFADEIWWVEGDQVQREIQTERL